MLGAFLTQHFHLLTSLHARVMHVCSLYMYTAVSCVLGDMAPLQLATLAAHTTWSTLPWEDVWLGYVLSQLKQRRSSPLRRVVVVHLSPELTHDEWGFKTRVSKSNGRERGSSTSRRGWMGEEGWGRVGRGGMDAEWAGMGWTSLRWCGVWRVGWGGLC